MAKKAFFYNMRGVDDSGKVGVKGKHQWATKHMLVREDQRDDIKLILAKKGIHGFSNLLDEWLLREKIKLGLIK